MWHNNRRKVLILLEKKIVRPSKLLILHNNQIGTFCIDCTDTPDWAARHVARAGGGCRTPAQSKDQASNACREPGHLFYEGYALLPRARCLLHAVPSRCLHAEKRLAGPLARGEPELHHFIADHGRK